MERDVDQEKLDAERQRLESLTHEERVERSRLIGLVVEEKPLCGPKSFGEDLVWRVKAQVFEAKALLSLVNECKKVLGSINCGCVIEDGYECPRCYMLRTIDDKLAEIGENYNG